MIDSALISAALDDGAPTGIKSAVVPIAALFKRDCNELMMDYLFRGRFSKVHMALLGSDRKCLQLKKDLAALAREIPVDETDSRGRTALAWAVEFGWPEAVNALLEYGADPHWIQPGRGKFSLLHLSAAGPRPSHRYADVVGILLRHGIDVNARDEEGWTPWHIAVSWNSREIMQELSSSGKVDMNACTKHGENMWDLFPSGDKTRLCELLE